MASLSDLSDRAIRLLNTLGQLEPDMELAFESDWEVTEQLLNARLIRVRDRKSRLSKAGWVFFREHTVPSCNESARDKCTKSPSKDCKWCKKELRVPTRPRQKLHLPRKYT